MGHQLSNPWWIPKPKTKEDMEYEIHTSKIKGPPSEEFTPETVSAVLKELNLHKTYEQPAKD